MVKRIFVEKKPGFDIEATHLYHDLQHILGISGISSVRMINRYDVEGISDSEYKQAREMIFSEPPVDYVYDEDLSLGEDEHSIVYEYLPGTYDQRADSCAQCIQLITEKKRPIIRTAKIVVIKGSLDSKELRKIEKHLVNPVESRLAGHKKQDSLEMLLDVPDCVETLNGFIKLNNSGRVDFMKSFGLAMNIEDLEFIQNYFENEEKRDPTVTEIRVIDTYWSDHCRHTTFLSQIDSVEIADSKYLDQCKDAYEEYKAARADLYRDRSDKPECLMDIAVMAMKEMRASGQLDDLEVSDEINACSIIVDADINGHNEEWLVMFKNETHNHPTEIEPFGGAATCLGGAIRDPLSGRAYVYQAMRVTGCGVPTVNVSETLSGKLPQIKITRDAAHGYSSYGNQIGLATGQVKEIYDDGFLAKRMEIGAVIAAAPRENIKRLNSDPGDIVILTGGRTGRDGCGGATGSSKEHDEDSLATCGAEVQKGNPPTERKIQRLFRNPKASKLIKKCNDFGAGGVAVAIGELAPGLIINLNKVPKKYEGLDGTELAISESQERMAVVVDPSDAELFFKLAADENLECAIVADITKENRLKMSWNNKLIVDLSREFLDTNGVTQHVNVKIEAPAQKTYFEGQVYNNLIERLKNLNSCSQKGLGERFDGSIGAGSILMPFGGINQMTPQEGIAAKLPVLESETNTATLMTYGYNPAIGKWSTFHGACYAVLESVAKITALGGDISKTRLTLQEYFEKLGKDEVKWGRPLGALLGAYYAQKKLLTPAIGGKDSMSGTFKDISVPPTLVSFAVSPVKADKVNSGEFKKVGSKIILIDVPILENHVPEFEKIREIYKKFKEISDEGQVLSAMTIKEGGIAETIANMSFGNNIGFEANDVINEMVYYKPMYGAIIAEVIGDTDYKIIGNTVKVPHIKFGKQKYKINELLESFQSTLEEVFPTNSEVPMGVPKEEIHQYKNIVVKKNKIVKPSVFIPVFPGTNCEYDTKKAFEKAGADVKLMVFRNLTAADVHESVEKMTSIIQKCNMIMIPGGFSAGDEPDGSGKFIATVFRNPSISEAVMELLNSRDGLVLGICNGFQALMKLGLLPYGDIRPMANDAPTLTFNKIGRHASCMVDTKIVSNKSPWLSLVGTGDIHTIPVSHGEGRFIASEAQFNEMFENGQIATQYVGTNGKPSYDIRFNPNGSLHAVEGITSSDGRVFGKMGHSERIGKNVIINIPGEKDQKIFEAGVRYFK